MVKNISHVLSCLHAVLVRVTMAVMEHHDQKQLREERVDLAFISQVTVLEENQNRNSSKAGNLEARTDIEVWRFATYQLFTNGLFSLLFYRTQDHQLRDGNTHNGLGPPPLITN